MALQDEEVVENQAALAGHPPVARGGHGRPASLTAGRQGAGGERVVLQGAVRRVVHRYGEAPVALPLASWATGIECTTDHKEVWG